MKSMTGYGRGVASANGCQVTVEVTAVNSRKQVESRFTYPQELSCLEPLLSQIIQKTLSRGNIHGTVSYQLADEVAGSAAPRINIPLALNVLQQLRQFCQEGGLPSPSLSEVLSFPGIYDPKAGKSAIGEMLQPLAEAALTQALEVLSADRVAEGKRLYDDLKQRGELIRTLLERIDGRGKEALMQLQERLRARIADLSKELPMDEEKLARELVFYAEKADITEEVVRLKSHLVKYFQLLDSENAPGRELDFLGQEMNREITTLSSKTADLCIADFALKMKIEISKIREQVMNIE